VKDQFQKSVRNHFIEIAKRPELLNRIGDNIVPFNFVVDSNFLVEIARSKLKPLRDQLKEKYRIKEFVFEDEDKALMALARVVDQKMGGRGVLNEMVKRIYDPLAEFLFEKLEDIRLYAGRTIKVITLGKAAEFDFELE
jgi:ATP-dependent Clp protease ATP-binding subunit ClpA